MINSVFNQNPLSIAILKGFKNCITSVILSLDNYLVIHPYSLKNLSIDSLIKLNLSSCGSLVTFYQSIFRKDTSEHLAKFCCNSAQLPVQFLSKNIYIENRNLLSKEALKEQEKPIAFMSSHILLDLTFGSQKSIDFLYSIHDSPNPNIIMTSLIQDIIRYKWRKISWVMYFQAFVYMLYMLLLSFYVLYFIENDSFLFVLFFLSMLLSLYEVYQFFASPLSYIKDLWNYIDIARTISSILYFVISLTTSASTITREVLSFLVIISWLRGIAYFRVFSNTRYMVNLISEVIKDMTSFLILLFYSTLSFAFIFLVLDNNNPQFIDYLKISYRFDVGDFDTADMNSMQWICFFLVSMINMIVMLNLLIAIMGDTFGKVQENYQIVTAMSF
ncbi:unnamed protein product [Blepharisma stoltei]|uniref:Ion transport domain-containing protein n=1 Tax=Blepharisma stoltei TaxID=1481888 RepID=A0AAU9JED4_9CILI|nr:unnamed protein product [Blepharisma stoltei]